MMVRAGNACGQSRGTTYSVNFGLLGSRHEWRLFCLQSAYAKLNPPLPPRVMVIALAKISTQQRQIAELARNFRVPSGGACRSLATH